MKFSLLALFLNQMARDSLFIEKCQIVDGLYPSINPIKVKILENTIWKGQYGSLAP